MEKLITIDELASFLKVNKQWIYKRTSKKAFYHIPHIKVGKMLRFDKDEVIEWIKKNN